MHLLSIKLRPAFLVTILTFVISFTVYLFTLSPTVGLEDSGEFIAAVASLGIAHPSGYPLYVVLGKLFTLIIPFGDIAWRVNLFSAFCASITVSLLSLLLINILSSLFPTQRLSASGSHIEKHLGGFAGMDPPIISGESETESRAVTSSQGKSTVSFRVATTSTYLVALSLSLFFAFSPVFWSQAIIAEVYTLNAALLIATLILLWRYAQTPSHATLLCFSFLCGLSITNHQMMILVAPVYLIFILCIDWKRNRWWTRNESIPTQTQTRSHHWYTNIHPYPIALLFFFLGLSLYLFILFRAWSDPLINWNHPDTLAEFWHHISRKSYNDFTANLIEDTWKHKKIIYVHYFFTDLLKQLNPVGALLSLCGFITLWLRKRSFLLLTLGVFFSNSVLIIILRRLGYIVESEEIYTVYYISSFLMAFVWTAIGIAEIIHQIRKYFLKRGTAPKPLVAALAILFLLFLPSAQGLSFARSTDRSDIWLTDDWGTALLQSLAPHAILLLFTEQPAADSGVFTLAYLSLIKKVRPDVAIVDYGYLSSRFYHPVGTESMQIMKLPFPVARARLLNRIWKIAQRTQRPIYTLYPVGTWLNGDLISRSNGIVYRVYPNKETAQRAHLTTLTPQIRNLEEDRFQNQMYYNDFISDLLYARASALLEQGQLKASEQVFLEAFSFDATPFAANARDYLSHQQRWLELKKPQTPMSKTQ
ncbi:MAG: DUF2723 domain-containing protein [Patescibacteria group bacterium]